MSVLKINDYNNINNHTNKNKFAIGIDLGTTNSLAATVYNGQAQILTDEKGRYLLPSVVYYNQHNYIVGYEARTNAIKDPINGISSVKRMIGRSLEDIKKRYPYLPYNFQSSKNGLPMIVTNIGMLSPVQVSADILNALVMRATKVHNKLDGVVITVPAYFDDAQRHSTKEAANLVGLNVLRLLNEPTAAAIAYGLHSNKEGIIVVYDLGGGTFDISILRLCRGVFEVLAIGGDSELGGDDFDHLLVDFICRQAGITNNNDIYLQQALLNIATTTKIALSTSQNMCINIAHWQGNISCTQFNELIIPLVKRTILLCHRALKDAGIKIEQISEIIMVGGSTRIPLIREYVSEFFGRVPLTSIDPDKVVAIGAAIQANILVGNKLDNDEMLLLDVIPLSLGLETMGGLMERMIPRNTIIPVTCTQEFTTFRDKQTSMSIHVVQGERELVRDCRSLAYFVLHNIPMLPAGKARIHVTFQVDADGLLNVTAIEKSSGIQASVRVKPSCGLTDSEIASMIHDSIYYNEQDTKARILTEQKLAVTHMLRSIDDTVIDDTTCVKY